MGSRNTWLHDLIAAWPEHTDSPQRDKLETTRITDHLQWNKIENIEYISQTGRTILVETDLSGF